MVIFSVSRRSDVSCLWSWAQLACPQHSHLSAHCEDPRAPCPPCSTLPVTLAIPLYQKQDQLIFPIDRSGRTALRAVESPAVEGRVWLSILSRQPTCQREICHPEKVRPLLGEAGIRPGLTRCPQRPAPGTRPHILPALLGDSRDTGDSPSGEEGLTCGGLLPARPAQTAHLRISEQ